MAIAAARRLPETSTMLGFRDAAEAGDTTSLLPVQPTRPSPDALTKLVKRLRALTLTLLPVEVEPSSINEPTSRVITPAVINAYKSAAGDFLEALPYCLLRARAEFLWDANHNPADYGENKGRAIACEVLARRIVHSSPSDKVTEIMSSRYQHVQADGDKSELSSALEMAIDSNCAIFLSSNEAQQVVNALWTGDIVQKNNDSHVIDYVHYSENREHTFWGHLDASRLSVPRYQNIFRITVWFFFLAVYSQAVREPLEKIDNAHSFFDGWETVLYIMSLSFIVENLHKFYTLLRFVTWRAFTFWDVIAIITDAILLTAFSFRVLGLTAEEDQAAIWRLRSFQVLSVVSPFIWMKLVTIFDGFKYIGTMQICVARMLKESGIFFALLSVLAIGFAQGLYALDAADGSTDSTSTVINLLVQALLQSPDYGKYSGSPPGLILYYFWNGVTAIILLNVLISLFSSAYSDVIEDAEAQYLAFFASKTIGMIRAPDSFVYPAPFNLLEAVFIAPLEMFPNFRLSPKTYAKLNRVVMGTIFSIPLAMIAFYESMSDAHSHSWMKNWLRGDDEGDADYSETRDPEVDADRNNGKIISRHLFKELIKEFPNMEQSSEAAVLKEIRDVKQQLDILLKKLDN